VHARSGMLHETLYEAQTSVVLDRKRGDAAAIVVRHQNKSSALVQRNETWAGSMRRYLVELFQRAALAIDRKRTHGAAFHSVEVANLVHRVQIFSVRMHRDERWIGGFGRQSDR